MSKGKKREADALGEVIHARTLREQRWAYEQRRKRLSWGAIADLAIKPPAEGGLGYARSPRALRDAYTAHVAEVVELEEATRPEATMHMLASLDEKHRALERLAHPVDELRTEQERRRAKAEGATDDEVEAIIVLRDERTIIAATQAAAAIDRDRAKLLGLDAPIAVEVTHHDGTIAELNDALARLGEKPAPTPKKVPR